MGGRIMQAVQLELEEQLEHLREMRDISLEEMTNAKLTWEEGYATGQHSAYEDAVERCEKIREEVTAVHTES